ncbi:MAG: tetratricopeptide repeat protein [Bacteroidota bacterium]|nr:tetratricopeptide repeat protein [Candidatus Kapabacteria bacterium]MDW8220325.1 tetratricopeptide repeat protein [Bacteroidota bacterium]
MGRYHNVLCCALVIVWNGSSVALHSQTSVLDSLLRVLYAWEHKTHARQTMHDMAYVNLLNSIAYQFWQQNADSGFVYAHKARQYAEQCKDKRGLAMAYENLGRLAMTKAYNDSALHFHRQAIYWYRSAGDSLGVANVTSMQGLLYRIQGKYAEALTEYMYALQLLASDTASASKPLRDKTKAKVLNNIGMVYRLQGRYNEAIQYLKQALALHIQYNNYVSVASIQSNIGLLFEAQERYEQALEWYIRALQTHAALNAKQGIANAYNNIGSVYVLLGKYDSANVTLRKAYEFFRSLGNVQGQSWALYNLATLAFRQGDWATAYQRHQEALRLRETVGDKEAIASSLIGVAETSFALGQYNAGCRALERAAVLADSIGALATAEKAYAGLAIEYERRRELNKAIAMYKRLMVLRDTLLSEKNARALMELQAQYQSEQKEQTIRLLESRQQLQAAELEQQRLARNYAILLGSMGIVLAGVAYYGYRTKRRAAEQLQEQNAEILRQQGILEEQAAEIETANTALQEKNIALKHQQEVLEEQSREIELANAVLQEKNAELERLNTEKNEFLGIVAHDLKNPVSHVIMASSMLLRYYDRMGDDEKQAYIGRIQAIARQMTEIITNLLDVNAIERGALVLHPSVVNASDVIQTVLSQYHERAAAKNITIQYAEFNASLGNLHDAVLLYADKQACMQVLDNLISNAIKYSPLGKTVHVRLRTRDSYGRIEVADEGPGISQEDMNKLFGKFARLSAQPTAGESSTGLGLSIVKKMVEAMNGRVWCESELGKGATFIVELPCPTTE